MHRLRCSLGRFEKSEERRSEAAAQPRGRPKRKQEEETAAMPPAAPSPAGRGAARSGLAAEATRQAAALEAARAAGLVVVLPIKQGGRMKVFTLEGVRRLTSVAHVPSKHVAAALDLCFTILTGEAPSEEYQVH